MLDYTGREYDNPEHEALRKILQALFYKHTELDIRGINSEINISVEELSKLFEKAIESLGKHDNPSNVFKLVKYQAEFILSEANWHQLLRHRKVNWIVKDPSINNGITDSATYCRVGYGKFINGCN